VDSGLEALSRMERDRHPAHTYREPDSLLATAWLAAARGRTSEARTIAARAAEFARTHGQHAREVLCLQAAVQFDDTHHASRLAELATLVKGPRADLAARWAIAAANHDGDALLDVSRDLETMGDRVAAADAAAHASLAFRRHNRRGAALTASGRATRIITDCGATTPATRAVTTQLPLTGREREIATLAADGLTNKEIAEALTVSVRTIENHIYRACSHLGVVSRLELAHLISEFAPADEDAIRRPRK
jgi:ATP/maltotriose-dependent transcriptional regulator MalT